MALLRLVLPWLFNLQAAIVDWSEERRRRNYDGPEFDPGRDPLRVQLRWMLHPALGLPCAPFTVLRLLEAPHASSSDQELADEGQWEELEIVGLPVDEPWGECGYPPDDQGPFEAPLPPREAALRRLEVGAPRIGWDSLAHEGETLPAWEPSDPRAFLQELLEGRLLGGIRSMLEQRPDPLTHASYFENAAGGPGLRLHPRLLDASAGLLGDVGVPDRPARTRWHPLGLLALTAGSDALASLALGFGTAVDGDSEDVFMVLVPHQLTVAGEEIRFALAAVVRLASQPRPPGPPTGLTAASIVRNRPQSTDGPFQETVGVAWDRPMHPRFSRRPSSAPYPASYSVAAFGPGNRRRAILLPRRSHEVGGWLPFVGSVPEATRPEAAPQIRFTDHVPLTTTVGGVSPQVIPDVIPDECTYAVAAQDLFGRWSTWRQIAYRPELERPQAPTLLGIRLDPQGALEVDFGWDWADRSPEFVELTGKFEDEPNTTLLSVLLRFGGDPRPQLDGIDAIPLDPNRAPAADWGSAQDRPGEAPGVRFYRLRATVPIAFGGRRSRTFEVGGRGQCHLHQEAIPGFNISPFGPPARATIYDPAPPAPPLVPEAPQWATLPDPSGVSRAVLSWSGDTSVRGYALYEATETALLSAFGRPGPDTSAPFTDRLAVLRSLDLPSRRSVFRRVRKDLISPTAPTTSFEVTLPRGSAVMHLYAVTALSHNEVESSWPASSKQFIAVAAPRLVVPAAPAVEATADPTATPPRVRLRLLPGRGPAPARIDVYRTTREALTDSADEMGPPLGGVDVNGAAELTFDDEAPPAGWRRLSYRAVAWTADDDPAGRIGARSPASSVVSVVLPPAGPPAVTDLSVNGSGSTDAECLVAWQSDTPVRPTPLGPHSAVVETTDEVGNPSLVRLEARLDELPMVAGLANLPPADPDHREIFRVGEVGATTRYAAWVPRPAPDESFHLTVKLIDPLLRTGRVEAEVPPLPPAPQLGSAEITPQSPPAFPPPPRLVVSWDIAMHISPEMLDQFSLRVTGPGGLSREALLTQIPEIPDPSQLTSAQLQALLGRIVRIAGQQLYFMILPFRTSLEVVVTLTDTLNRVDSRVARLP
jgi:hypothetical protein